MKDLDYRQTFDLCTQYARLGSRKQRIIEFLFERDYFEGNFTDLTRALGYNRNYQNNIGNVNASNIRKECNKLAELGLINIVYDDRTEYDDDGNILTKVNYPKAFFLMDGWIDALLRKGGAK